MQKVLIVHAHPESKSFNAALAKHAQAFFIQQGSDVKFIDLYAEKFNPVGDAQDFLALEDSEFFKYQKEQMHAFETNSFTPELKAHMNLLEWCDILVFNFPLWWFAMPAILKGWVDRVFAMGFVYGGGKGVYDTGIFKDKTAFLCITTGGPEQAYNGGKNGHLDQILFPIQHGIFYFTGMTVLPPFIAFSPARKTQEERETMLNDYSNYLTHMDQYIPIYSNR